MRSSFSPRGGLALVRTPNYRRQAARRRLMAIGAVLGLALASGLVGSMTTPKPEAQTQAVTGPFSYFPSE